MRKNKVSIRRTISLALCLMIFIGATSLQSTAGAMLDAHRVQKTLRAILGADLRAGQDGALNGIGPTTDGDGLYGLPGDPVHDPAAAAERAYQAELRAEAEAYETDRFIIKYADGAGPPDGLGQAVASARIATIEAIGAARGGGSYAVVGTTAAMRADELKAAMEAADGGRGIEYVQPDFLMTTSSDPLLGEQWGVANPGGAVDAGVAEAWAHGDGAGVTIAIIDSGIDLSHPDLAGGIDTANAWDFRNGDGTVDDAASHEDQWHSTHLAGVMAARRGNGVGIAGVAPGASVLPLKAFEGGQAYTSDIICL